MVLFIFATLALVPNFSVGKISVTRAAETQSIESSIFIKSPTYSTFYNKHIYFIDEFDNLLKIYDINGDVFSKVDLPTHDDILTATSLNNSLFFLASNSNVVSLYITNLDTLEITKVETNDINLSHYKQISVEKALIKPDATGDASEHYIISLTPNEINNEISPLLVLVKSNDNSLSRICKVSLPTIDSPMTVVTENLHKFFTVTHTSTNEILLVYFYNFNVGYTSLNLERLTSDTISISVFSQLFENIHNELSDQFPVSIKAINIMEIENTTHFLVSFTQGMARMARSINILYKYVHGDGSTTSFEPVDSETCSDTNFILTNENYIIYPDDNQTIVYKKVSFAPTQSDKYPVSGSSIANPTVDRNYFEDESFTYYKTISDTYLLSSPWSASGNIIIPAQSDIIKIGFGSVSQNEISDFAYVLYTANNTNYVGYVKLADMNAKAIINLDNYEFSVAKAVPNSNLYSLPTKVVGDQITDNQDSSVIMQIKANSRIEVVDAICKYSANGSVFVKVKVNNMQIGYIDVADLILPSSYADFITTNAEILKDGTKVYQEANLDSVVIATLNQHKMVRVDGVRDTKTGFTKITFNDEYGVEFTGYIQTDYVKTNTWSSLQIIGCVLIAVNLGLLILILVFKKKHIGKTGQKYTSSKKPNYKENKLLKENEEN